MAGIELSVGSKGDGYDNALAETTDGLYKAEAIVESQAGGRAGNAAWVAWFNHHRLMEPLSYLPTAEFEAHYDRQHAGQAATV